MEIPKGFTVKVIDGQNGFTVDLWKGRKLIGNVSVYRVSSVGAGSKIVIHETHAQLDDEFHQMGLGLLIYSQAIEHGLKKGYNVASSSGPSAEAQRVWTSRRLKEKYDVVKLARRWCVFGRQ